MRRAPVFAAVATALLFNVVADAHQASDSFLHLAVRGDQVDGQWDIAWRDLDLLLSLDGNGNGDGQLVWGEVRRREAELGAYALKRLGLSAQGEPCRLTFTQLLNDTHSDGGYAVLRFSALCPDPVQVLGVRYQLLAGVDAAHRGLLSATLSGRVHSAVLGPAAPEVRLAMDQPARWAPLVAYFRTGVEHIWTGYDHLLFLFSLLLPAVLLRRNRRWEAQPALRPVLAEVGSTVTAFTIAHSLTLGLATVGIVSVPTRAAETVIALSVVLAAMNNVWPLVSSRRWVVAFCFGLVHGIGFASLLSDLGLPTGARAWALLGFNLGVEAGQLAIVAAFLPFAWYLRSTQGYRRLGVVGGSLVIAVFGAGWLAERALDLG